MAMQYLDAFRLPTEEDEAGFLLRFPPKLEMTCYDQNNAYPFKIFPQKRLERLTFEPITVFCGGNGSGKSTLLNVIAEKLQLPRKTPFNYMPLYEDYLRMCRAELRIGNSVPKESRIITSDAVFDYMLDLRAMNEGIDLRRNEIFADYDRINDPNSHFQLSSMEDFEEYREFHRARRETKSAYTRRRMPEKELRGRSNGESAFAYFTAQIGEHALFLLDEPENSLSAELQKKLADFLVESMRFYECQFIIATHSPFLLGMKDVKIYDLDAAPAAERRWTELPMVKTYYDFFREHQKEFEK